MRRTLFPLAIITVVAVVGGVVTAGTAHGAETVSPHSPPVTFALLGDTPYGDAQRAAFPALADVINADPDIRMVLHAGDVKNGSSTCDTPASPTSPASTAPSRIRSC